MAVIRTFRLLDQDRERDQPEAIEAAIVPLQFGEERFLQINSYGSTSRVNVGARSQNLRLSKEAFDQLVELGHKHFGGH